jgi:cation/acetate symporter
VVAFAFGLAAASLFPPILLGIFFKRMNKEGAIAGMLTGLLFTYGYIEYFKGLFLKWTGSPWGENVASEWLFGISPEGIGVVGMLLNVVVALGVSHFTAPPPQRIQELVEHIRVPQAGRGASAATYPKD